MSRGEFGARGRQSYGTISGATQPPVTKFQKPGHEQQEFERLSDSVSSSIFQINSNTAALEKILKQISSGKQVHVPQEKIHRIQQGTNQLANKTTTYLKNMTNLCGSSRPLRIQHERLKEEFRESVSRYYSVQNKIADKEKTIVQSSSTASRQDPFEGGFGTDQTQLLEDENRRNEREQLSEQIAVDEAIVYEREDRIRQIEADILDINEIFHDLATMVHEQGEMIDSIEGNIDRTQAHVEDANTQLLKATYYQKAARKKMCCLLVIGVVVAGVVAISLYFILRKH